MTSSETSLELDKLRAEVAALRAAKEEAATEPDGPAAASAEPSPSAATAAAEEEAPETHIKSQLEELTDLLETEIRDLPTITSLAVFTAGILLGRFLR
ncbi:MAG: hypothetical protein ACN4GT_14610 [Gammaproteobacteria bacterium]